MEKQVNEKNWIVNLGFICLSYSLLVVFLGYFAKNYQIDFLNNSFLFKIYFSMDNSFAGYIITGIWSFLDIFVLVTIFALFYSISEKIINSLEKNV